jgi:hypothetical protein
VPEKHSLAKKSELHGETAPPEKFLTRAWNKTKPYRAPIVSGSLVLAAAQVFDIDWEKASYIATVAAIIPLFAEHLKQQQVENAAQEEENRIEREQNWLKVIEEYNDLSDVYDNLMLWLADRADINEHTKPIYDPKTARKQLTFYSVLLSKLERAHMGFYHPDDERYDELWQTWDDAINDWMAQPNFRRALPQLLRGENPHFVEFMKEKLKAAPPLPEPSGPLLINVLP